MLSLLEKEMAIETSTNFFNNKEGKLLFKIISNYLANTSELSTHLKNLDDNIFYDEEKLKKYSKTIISYMADIAIKSESAKTYTTGQLAKFFGVSITTINNWIHEQRFIGILPKSKYKQARINENVLWKNTTGELIPIKEIVKMYESQSNLKVIPKDEYKILMSEIKYFENKYKGSYKETLFKKINKSDEENRDESEWKYLIDRLKK